MEIQNDIYDVFREPTDGGFSRQAVPRSAIEEMLDIARRAPSGTNTQPWNVYVLQGQSRAMLVDAAAASVLGLMADPVIQAAFWEQFSRHPGNRLGPVLGPRQASDDFLSAAMAGLGDDAATAQSALARYFRFFDAPVGLIFTISKFVGMGSLLDYGMFLQNMALAARARSLRTSVQMGWKGLSGSVLLHLQAPTDALVVCGMALGYADASQPPVSVPSKVPAVESFTTWHG